MSKKEIQALVTEVATSKLLGDFRYIKKENGEIWFFVVDVCKILDIKNPRDVVANFPDDEKMTVANTDGHSGKRGGAQKFNVVNEPGLYRLIFQSRKPEAEKFKRWVFHEVLPQIRKYGYYSLLDEKYKNRELLREALPNMTQEEILELANEPDIVVWRVQGEKNWRVEL